MKAALPAVSLFFAAPLLLANQDAPTNLFGPESLPFAIDPQFELSPQAICNDTVMAIRSERGLPLLDRRVADANEPILFLALDHEIDGCDVLVTGNGEVRPIPRAPDGPLRPQPAQ